MYANMTVLPDTIDSIVFINSDGMTFQFDGPFEAIEGTRQWEAVIPVGTDEAEAISPDVAETYEDALGETALALVNGSVAGSGDVVGSDVVDDELLVLVDDPRCRSTPNHQPTMQDIEPRC